MSHLTAEGHIREALMYLRAKIEMWATTSPSIEHALGTIERDLFGPRRATDTSAPALTGRFRLYFNRHDAAPLSWCIAPESGAWEMAVRSVAITVPAETVYAPKAEPDDEDGRPSAWIAVEGRLEVDAEGKARFV